MIEYCVVLQNYLELCTNYHDYEPYTFYSYANNI